MLLYFYLIWFVVDYRNLLPIQPWCVIRVIFCSHYLLIENLIQYEIKKKLHHVRVVELCCSCGDCQYGCICVSPCIHIYVSTYPFRSERGVGVLVAVRNHSCCCSQPACSRRFLILFYTGTFLFSSFQFSFRTFTGNPWAYTKAKV